MSNFQYFFLRGSFKINICKKSFISLHGITEGRVRRLLSLLLEDRFPKDRRVIHTKPNLIPSNICQNRIPEHIQSFSTKFAHYGGKQLLYLDTKLDVKTALHVLGN